MTFRRSALMWGKPPAATVLALFKRAQVSVLLKENDAPSRIEMARRHATPLTRELIARERLFGGTQN